MQAFKTLCLICKSELKSASASQHCGGADCRMAWLRRQGDRALAQQEEKQKTLNQAINTAFMSWQQEQQSEKKIKVVEVPHNPHQPISVSAKRKRAFLSHLRQLLENSEVEDPSAVYTPLLKVDSTEDLDLVLGSLCATCNGHCCRQGQGTQAFIQKQTLNRVLAANPNLDDDSLLALYEAYIPEAAVEDSCIFHTATGCCLDESLRADICGSFFCKSLHDFIESDFKDGAYIGVMAFGISDFDIKRKALIDPDGRRSVIDESE